MFPVRKVFPANPFPVKIMIKQNKTISIIIYLDFNGSLALLSETNKMGFQDVEHKPEKK